MSKDEGVYIKCVRVKGSDLLVYPPSDGFLDFILTDIEVDENAIISADEAGVRKLRDYLNYTLGDTPDVEKGRAAIRKALPKVPGDLLDHGLYAALKAMGINL